MDCKPEMSVLHISRCALGKLAVDIEISRIWKLLRLLYRSCEAFRHALLRNMCLH